MELEGKISAVLAPNTGVSKATGNAWMSQEYVMAYYWFPNQTQPSFICLRAFGEDRIKKFGLQPNDEVKIRFHAEAHESNGRWFNELRIDGVTFVGASAGKNEQPKAQGEQQQGADQQEQQQNQPQGAEQQEGGDKDDMPF